MVSSSSSSDKKLSQHNSVFRRRQSTVIKKAQELSTLCGVDVCVICYGPDESLQTWPQDIDKVRDIAFKYRSLDDTLRRKRSLNLSSFLDKIEHNHGRDSMDLGTRVDGLSPDRLSELGGLLERNILCLKQRLRFIESEKHKAAANKKIDDAQISSSCQPILGQTQSVNFPVNPRFSRFGMDEQNAAAMLDWNAFSENGYNNSLQYAYCNPGFNGAMVPERRRMIQQNLMANGGGSGGWPCNGLGFSETGMGGESRGMNMEMEWTNSGLLVPQGYMNNNHLMFNPQHPQFRTQTQTPPLLQFAPFSDIHNIN